MRIEPIKLSFYQKLKSFLSKFLCFCVQSPIKKLYSEGQKKIKKELDIVKMMKIMRMARYRLKELPSYSSSKRFEMIYLDNNIIDIVSDENLKSKY